MYLRYYLERLNFKNMPEFLLKYLEAPSLKRLKKVGYFCGMEYASKDIYNFRESFSRYDHSLNVALLVYKLTKNKIQTLAGLFHDIATPCFSHVIDYMNKDYKKQESTEEYTEKIIKSDKYLMNCFEKDNIDVKDIINFKNYSIVDNARPKLCADRLDGVILNGIGCTKNIELEDIKAIIDDITVFKNEDGENEIGFRTMNVCKKVVDVSESIDIFFHSDEDNYMMELLANITRIIINKKYIKYEDLYSYNEEELFAIILNIKDDELSKLMYEFKNIRHDQISETKLSELKHRNINPLINGNRFSVLIKEQYE